MCSLKNKSRSIPLVIVMQSIEQRGKMKCCRGLSLRVAKYWSKGDVFWAIFCGDVELGSNYKTKLISQCSRRTSSLPRVSFTGNINSREELQRNPRAGCCTEILLRIILCSVKSNHTPFYLSHLHTSFFFLTSKFTEIRFVYFNARPRFFFAWLRNQTKLQTCIKIEKNTSWSSTRCFCIAIVDAK